MSIEPGGTEARSDTAQTTVSGSGDSAPPLCPDSYTPYNCQHNTTLFRNNSYVFKSFQDLNLI